MPNVAPAGAEYRSLLLAELGQAEDSALAAQLTVLWRRAGGVSGGKLDVQYLRAKLSALRFLLGNTAEAVDATEGDATEKFSQLFDHWREMVAGTQEELTLALKAAAAGRAPSVGTLNRTAPIQVTDPCPPPTTLPDANDRAYRGDPYRRSEVL